MTLQSELRRLFIAVFEDGTQIFQTSEDKSTKFEGRSAFTDVLNYPKRLTLFILVGVNDESFASVDLDDGSFEINGNKFRAIPNSKNLPPGGKYELIYYRDVIVTLNSNNEATHEHWYRIGWKYQVDSVVYEQTIVLN